MGDNGVDERLYVVPNNEMGLAGSRLVNICLRISAAFGDKIGTKNFVANIVLRIDGVKLAAAANQGGNVKLAASIVLRIAGLKALANKIATGTFTKEDLNDLVITVAEKTQESSESATTKKSTTDESTEKIEESSESVATKKSTTDESTEKTEKSTESVAAKKSTTDQSTEKTEELTESAATSTTDQSTEKTENSTESAATKKSTTDESTEKTESSSESAATKKSTTDKSTEKTEKSSESAATKKSTEDTKISSKSVATIVNECSPQPVGQIHFSHKGKRPISLDAEVEIVCPACSYATGDEEASASKVRQVLDIVLSGLHVENKIAKKNSKLKPLKTPLVGATYYVVRGSSISTRGPPDYDFDVICPKCAYVLGAKPSVTMFNKIVKGVHLHEDLNDEDLDDEGSD